MNTIINGCLNVFIGGHFLYRTLICQDLSKTKPNNVYEYLILRSSFKAGLGIRTIENRHRDDQKVATAA